MRISAEFVTSAAGARLAFLYRVNAYEPSAHPNAAFVAAETMAKAEVAAPKPTAVIDRRLTGDARAAADDQGVRLPSQYVGERPFHDRRRTRGENRVVVVIAEPADVARHATRIITRNTPLRSDVGLPERGFVFCSFNGSYKITPKMFDVWMRLLQKTEGSVLWLREANAASTRNLRREAESRGVAGAWLGCVWGAGGGRHLALGAGAHVA